MRIVAPSLLSVVEHPHDLLAVCGIEVAGRLVGKNQLRISDHGPGNGYALLLTAR